MNVVFHIDELEKWSETANNVKNLLKEPYEITIIVLVNGKAINGYLAPESQAFIAMKRVTFHACNNALRANQIPQAQLPKNVIVVPSGVLDLIELQAAGYAYIKP
ncbi:DsrE family protein [Enterococcus xiangfangensis]|uniref:DsrE family protein n=1 Tax=Enterococcus xiangfangensis TaxID=1296537 RepID=A0ABU3FCM1_9ENTE|nr:DsrE family protein [Enterococcus xiangfangensis]MDT2760425.1 DsrE family protein [Enterococcus xiangfangensis]